MTLVKKCPSCGNLIKGRADKKYCNDHCRNAHNNELKRNDLVIRNINNALLRNRRILEDLQNKAGKATPVTRDILEKRRFHFAYITHTITYSPDKTYYYCYDYGYRVLENGLYLVVKGNQTGKEK